MKRKMLAVMMSAMLVGSLMAVPAFAAENLSDTTEGIAQFDGLEADDAYDFQIVVKSFQSTYWQAALQGMDQAAEELGVTYSAQGPVLESLQAAKDAGVPIVAFDTGIADAPEGSVVCTVVTDNTAAGEVAAINLYEAVKDQIGQGDPVRIGEINQDNYALNIQQRGLGFINKLIELAGEDGYTVAMEGNEFYVDAAEGAVEGDADIILEVRVPAQTTVDLCSTEAGTILDKEDTIAVFGSNQTAAEGLLVANDNREVLGDTVVGVGFDAGTSIKAAVEDGTFLGAVTQSPLMMGYYCIYALTAAANGQELIDVPTDGYWYDASNMDDENIAPNLYD